MHACFAKHCETEVKDNMLMCARHWGMVPRDVQHRVWAGWRHPAKEGHAEAVLDAMRAVAAKESGDADSIRR